MDSVPFSDCLLKAREVRAYITSKKPRLALAAAEALREMLPRVLVAPPIVLGGTVHDLADALVAQAEGGSVYGMGLEVRDLVITLDHMIGDAEDLRREQITLADVAARV